jgi:CRP-like cAMP-binding protein
LADTSTDVWDLEKLQWLAHLDGATAGRLRRVSRSRTVKPGAIVFSPSRHPEHVYILESGLVRVFRVSSRGSEVSFGYIHPGEVFGELAALGDRPRESFAVAIQRSVVWSVPRADFVRVIQSDAAVLFEMARQIEGRFKRIESRVEDFALRDVYARLARILLQLGDEFGEPNGSGVAIRFPLTQSDLATFIGATRQTVSTTLSRMRREGLIARRRDQLCLLRPDELRGRIEQEDAIPASAAP